MVGFGEDVRSGCEGAYVPRLIILVDGLGGYYLGSMIEEGASFEVSDNLHQKAH